MMTFWKVTLSLALSGWLVSSAIADNGKPNRGKGKEKGNASAREDGEENGKGRSSESGDSKGRSNSDDDDSDKSKGKGKGKDAGKPTGQGDDERANGAGNAKGKGTGNAFANGKGNTTNASQPIVQLPKEIELNDEQKLKVAEIEKELSSQMAEARANLDVLLTNEQKTARHNVIREARGSGKKGRELQIALKEATKAPEAQQKKIEVAEQAILSIQTQALEKVKPILTEKQTAILLEHQSEGKKRKEKKGT